MNQERAEFDNLTPRLTQLGAYLDQYLLFQHDDAMRRVDTWRAALDIGLPEQGVGLDRVLREMGEVVIPNGSQIPNPGSSAFITTGATSVGVLANLSALVAAPQRLGIHAFNFLEEKSLQWLAEMFELPNGMKGVYSSGGSSANIIGLGAARQWAYERIGTDPAEEGVNRPGRIYTTAASHHTIHRAAAVLGLGRNAVVTIESDAMGRMIPACLERNLVEDARGHLHGVAVVANAGTTGTGAIDFLSELGRIAKAHQVWFHVDGAYGLPGILDKRIRPLYDGIELADSVTVDPHKWMGAPVGIGATFVRDRSLLHRAFTQGTSDYLEGACALSDAMHSMDQLGIPYHDFGLELSAPSRGVVVWALIRELGKQGLAERVCRHNDMARQLARFAHASPELEVVQEPTLSICCIRYVDGHAADLNELNTRIHRRLIHNNLNMPSTVMVNGKLAIRPCFVGARADARHVISLLEEVLTIGRELTKTKQIANF